MDLNGCICRGIRNRCAREAIYVTSRYVTEEKRSMSTIDSGCNYYIDLLYATSMLGRARVYIYISYCLLHKIVMSRRALPSNGRFPSRGETPISRERDKGPLLTTTPYYRAQVVVSAAAVRTRSVERASTGKRLFRNVPLATGHPLARIRVFNSRAQREENEEESDRKKEGYE